MTISTWGLMTVLLAAAPEQFPVVSESFASLFEPQEYTYTGGEYQQQLFRYRLFVPHSPKPEERYPLLVWFHGCREDGDDNRNSLRWLNLILDDPNHMEKYRFFILVVQCPKDKPIWNRELLDMAFEILEKTLREHPVDPNRVYLAGVSGGGSGCWEMALRHPDTFAAVVPIASVGCDTRHLTKLAGIPVWVFHNVMDWNSPPEGDRRTVAALEKAGGNVHLTLVRSHGHDCWQTALHQYNVMGWMLAQHRGATIGWTPPGCKPWKWWHVFGVPAASVAILVTGYCSERKRRQRRRIQAAESARSEISMGIGRGLQET